LDGNGSARITLLVYALPETAYGHTTTWIRLEIISLTFQRVFFNGLLMQIRFLHTSIFFNE
jgi:hypothetical protein